MLIEYPVIVAVFQGPVVRRGDGTNGERHHEEDRANNDDAPHSSSERALSVSAADPAYQTQTPLTSRS
jgi:hypothetical protein